MASGISSYDEVLSVLLDIDTKDLKTLDGNISKLGGLFNAATGAAKVFIGTLAALDAGILAAGYSMARKASDFEALEISLNAVEGSAKRAKASLAELRDIAKGPGLGVQSAIETYSGLRRGGIDHDLAMSITKEIGNAIAYTGGGRDELSRIGIALSQIAVSPTLRGQDVMQLAQARLPVYQALKNQFGTADTEKLQEMGISSAAALKALRDEFAKLPRVTGGAKNSFENLSDAIEYAEVQIGKGINEGIMPMINDFTDQIGKLNEDGSLKDFGVDLAEVFTSIFDSVLGEGATAREQFDTIMQTILTISYASRNFIMNFEEIWNFLVKMSPLANLLSRTKALGQSPADEAAASMEGINNMREMRARQKMHGRIVVDPNTGVSKRQIEVSPGVWMDEDKLSAVNKKDAIDYWRHVQNADPKAVLGNDPAKTLLPTLKDIRDNTKPIQRFMDAIIGGGFATKAGASEHNLAGMSGAGGSNRHIRMIIDGLQGLQGEMAANMGRGVNPKSF